MASADISESSGTSAEEYKLQGNEKYKKGDYRGAIALYSQAIDAAPTESAYYGNRAAANMMLLKYDDVIKDCNRAIVMDPNFSKGYVRKAKAYIAKGNFDEALDTYHKALIRDPNNTGLLNEKREVQMAIDKLERGRDYLAKDRYYEALSCFDAILKLASNHGEAKLLKAEALIGRERYDEAFALLTQLMRSQTQTPNLLFLRAQCLYFQGEFDNAIKHLQQALRSDPDNTRVMKEFKRIKALESKKEEANAAFKAQQWEDAIAKYTVCLGMDPKNKPFNAKLHCNRATALSKQKKFEEAIRDCDKAIYFDSSYAKAHLRKAACLRSLGGEENLDQALREYDAASKLLGDDAQRDIQMSIRETKLALKKAKRKDYYKILGVGQDATDAEIKKAYRKSALKYHPDRHSGKTDAEKAEAEKNFKEIGEAYALLSDPQKKQQYDSGMDLEEMEQGGGFGGGGMGGVDPSEIFSMFFNGGGMGGMGGMHGHGARGGGFHFG